MAFDATLNGIMERADVEPFGDVEDELAHDAGGQDHRHDTFRARFDFFDDDVLDAMQLLALIGSEVRQDLARSTESQIQA